MEVIMTLHFLHVTIIESLHIVAFQNRGDACWGCLSKPAAGQDEMSKGKCSSELSHSSESVTSGTQPT